VAPPAELLEAAANVVRPRVEDKQIAIEVRAADTLPLVDVDVPRFAHALDNLVDNAITYTRPGGRIVLSAASPGLRTSRSRCPTPEWEFRRSICRASSSGFFKFPAETKDVAKGAARGSLGDRARDRHCHGGTITCESELGAGTKFTITLPAANGQAAKNDEYRTNEATGHRLQA